MEISHRLLFKIRGYPDIYLANLLLTILIVIFYSDLFQGGSITGQLGYGGETSLRGSATSLSFEFPVNEPIVFAACVNTFLMPWKLQRHDSVIRACRWGQFDTSTLENMLKAKTPVDSTTKYRTSFLTGSASNDRLPQAYQQQLS
ncbi:hypothetical protein PAXRUDRAFT_216377 [Paxillus rubicundulus Ve08.2h10]|uniref:Uncharacterized protein n=1 Tax=Paxillus rubicundulus Ve08.2h10 TaxID=930991 RepID=A0A0D0E6A7_9AGAM|nr:hypothetical protein PAXRUDRAFT_216377 [Paxillus rubicundulus Ve08.2h10]